MLTVKAARMLSNNIEALLRARHQSGHDLAQWCHHSDVWISLFLAGKRQIQLKDLDRIADFFGLATYQLFQPGISSLTERRVSTDRRSGRDRRIGVSKRLLGALADQIDSARPQRGSAHEPSAVSATTATHIQRLVTDMQRRLTALLAEEESRRQDPRTREKKPPPRRRTGTTGEPNPSGD